MGTEETVRTADPPETWYRISPDEGEIVEVPGVVHVEKTVVLQRRWHRGEDGPWSSDWMYSRSEVFPSPKQAAEALVSICQQRREVAAHGLEKARERLEAAEILEGRAQGLLATLDVPDYPLTTFGLSHAATADPVASGTGMEVLYRLRGFSVAARRAKAWMATAFVGDRIYLANDLGQHHFLLIRES